MTPRELLLKAAAQIGFHEHTLELMLRSAGWGPKQLEAELAEDGWYGRLEEVLRSKYIERSLWNIGPEAARSLTDTESLNLITPKLRKAVAAYEHAMPALLLGKTGIGKTLAARLMARQTGRTWAGESIAKEKHKLQNPDVYTASRINIVWTSATDLALAVSRHPLGKGAPEEMSKARDAALLVLDDLTWPARDEATLEVLGARYNSGLPTIATAGCTCAELVLRFGDAVVRRLLQCKGKQGLLVEEQ